MEVGEFGCEECEVGEGNWRINTTYQIPLTTKFVKLFQVAILAQKLFKGSSVKRGNLPFQNATELQ